MTTSQKPPAIVRGRSSLHGIVFVEDEIEDAIDPNARALKLWHHVLLLCVMYEMFLIPYFMSFRSDASLMLIPETKVTILMELLFLVDFAVQAHTGYYEDGNLVRDKRRTRRRYLTSIGFLRDAFTIVPFSLFIQGVAPRAALEMHKVLRCLKVRQYMRDIDDLHAKHFVLIKFLRLLLATVFVSHCLACVRHQFGYKGQSDNHWLPPEPSGPHSVSEEYLTALFWAFGLLSGLFEAELPHSITQFLFTMSVAICGFLMFTSHCAIFFMISRCESGASEPAEAKIKQLRHLLQFHHVPEHLQRHAIDYLSRYYTDVESNDREVMKLLCPSITNDIQVELLKGQVAAIPILHGCTDDFVVTLTSVLTFIAVPSLTTVFQVGDFGDSMYIVQSGVFDVMVNGAKVRELRKGVCFGELSVFSNRPRTATVVSATYATMYRLARFHAERILSGYPQCASAISKNVENLMNQGSASMTTHAAHKNSNLSVLTDLVAFGAQVKSYIPKVQFGKQKKGSSVLPAQGPTETSDVNDESVNDGPSDRFRSFYDKRSSQYRSNSVPPTHSIWRKILRSQCIDADTTLRMWWLLALQVVLLYDWFLVPLRLTFPRWGESVWYIQVTDVIIDSFLFADMYFNCNLSFTQDSEKIMDPLLSASRYLQGAFIVDLILCFPYWVFTSLIHQPTARFPHLFRVWRLKGHYREVNQYLHLSNRKRLLCLGIILVMLYHGIACLHFGITQIEGFSPKEEAWIPSDDIFLERVNETFYRTIDNQLLRLGDSHLRKIAATQYFRSLYYAANVLAAVGKTIEPDSEVQYIFALVFMLSGFLITSIVVDNVQKRFTATAFEHKEFYAIRTRIQLFLLRQKAPLSIFQRVNSFLDFWWSAHRGAFINELLADLPSQIRRDLIVSICSPALHTLALMSGVRPMFDKLEDFFVANVKFILFGQGEVVYRQGDYASGIYFLLEGEVCVITNAENPRGMAIGTFFGTAALTAGGTTDGYGEHVSASSGCILLFISREHLVRMEEIYPQLPTELLVLERKLSQGKLAQEDLSRRGRKAKRRRSAVTSIQLGNYHKLSFLYCSHGEGFDPDSPWILMWETWLFIAMTIQWMTVVFLVCFNLTQHRYTQADFLSAFLELSFVIDIYVRSHLGFYAFGNKVMDLQSIRRQYFKSTLFFIDAVALIPLFVVNWSRTPQHRLDVLNINKLLRLFKVPGQLRALENRYLKWTTELRLFKLLYYTFMLSHIFGCIWFDFASGSSGIFSPEGKGITAFGHDKWFPWAELEHASLGLQYFSSIFWSFALMSASSTGELPKECLECVFSVITMTSGFFLFAYVIGNFTDIIELVDSNQREFFAKMASVRLLLAHFTLPRSIEDRLKTFYAFQRFHTITQEHVLEKCLPPSMLTDIRLVHLKPMIDKVSFLQNMNSSVTRLLVSHFTQMLVLRDEYVCRYGEDGYDMFFVFTGVLEVLIPGDQGQTGNSSAAAGMSTRLSTRFNLLEMDDQLRGMLKKVNELSSGDYFGENGLFTNSARNAYVRALTSCTLYRLSRESLELVFGRYPQWQEKVLRIASLQREQQRLAGLSAEEQKRSCDENMGTNLSRVDEINLQAERLEEDLQLVRIRRVDTTISVQDALRSTALGKVHGRMDDVVRRSATSIFSGADAQSPFHLRWLRLSVFFTVFMALVIPYQITLDKMDRLTGVAPVIKAVEIISELFFALDIWFSWHVKECLASMELYEQSHRSIYRRQRLFWDVIAAFPFDRLLADFTGSQWLRLLRCTKVANVVVYLGELNRSNISYEMNRFRGAILVYSLLIYWCGCAYLAVCQDAGFGDKWDAWVPSKHLEISDPHDPSPEQLTLRLLRGVFYGMTAFVKKGKTFTPLSVSLVVFSVATCFLGLLVLAFMIGEIATLYVSYIWYEIDFRKNQIAVDLYLSRVRVSNSIKRRTQAFLSSLWSSHYGVNYDSIFTEMPEAIRTSCITHIAQRPLRLFVNNVFRVISNDSPEVIESFALSVARRLHFEGYPRDETVVSEGSVTRAMYIVIKGHLKVTSKAAPDITKSKSVIRRGEFFGDRGLLGCAISRTTIRTLRACELLSISAQDMQQVVDEHPVTHLAAAMVDRAQIRMDAFLLTRCSRDEMESHWGSAIFREARHAKKRALDLRAQHHNDHRGHSKSFVLSKRHIEEFFQPLSSPSDCIQLFLPFLQMLLPHDPLDWDAMQARRGSQILTASSPIGDPHELVAQDISQAARSLKGGIKEEDEHKDEHKTVDNSNDVGDLESIEPADLLDPLS